MGVRKEISEEGKDEFKIEAEKGVGWDNEETEGTSIEALNSDDTVITYLSTREVIKYSDEAWKRMKQQESDFIYQYAADDDCFEYKRTENIKGFSEYSLVIADGKTKPWYCNTTIMGILDVLMLGWIQRLIFYYSARPAMLKLTKVILR